jgi:hypothetical protein
VTLNTLIRLGGLALLTSGILTTLGFLIHPHDSAGSNHGTWVGAHVVIISGGFLNLLGLVALYLVWARRLGPAALLGFLLAAASLVLYSGKLYWSGFIYPLVIAQNADFIRSYGFNPGADPVDPIVRMVFNLGPILFAVGYSLLGMSLIRVKAYPAAALGAVVVGAILVGVWPLLPGVVQHLSVVISFVYTVGISWVGYLLATRAPALESAAGFETGS